LVILTATPRLDFVTVTIKMYRGVTYGQLLVGLKLFDGKHLLEERVPIYTQINLDRTSENESPASHRIFTSIRSPRNNNIDCPEATNHITPSPNQYCSMSQQQNSLRRMQTLEIGESFLLRVPPNRLPNCHIVIQLFAHVRIKQRTINTVELVDEESVSGSFDHLMTTPANRTITVNLFVGNCDIGSTSGTDFHWRQMIKKAGVPVCMWHYLVDPTKKSI